MSDTSIAEVGPVQEAARPKRGGINGFLDRVVGALEIVLALTLIAAVALNFVNIGGRYLFNYSIIGSDEVQVYLLVGMTFVGVAAVTWREIHLRMDVLVRYFPDWLAVLLRGAERVVLALIAGLLLYVSSSYALKMHALESKSHNAEIPMWIPHSALVVGFGLAAVIAVWRLTRRGREGVVVRRRDD